MSEQSVEPAAQPKGADVETSPNTCAATFRLLAVIAAILIAAAVTETLAAVIVLFAVIVMIMVHELGHFATAKWSGMKVTEYFLGFGPRLWSIRRGETEYGVKAIPAGGYVKIIGMNNLEEVDPVDEQRTYRQKPFHQRLMVAVAGSFMHFVMAFGLLFVVIATMGMPTDQSNTTVETVTALKGAQSPAEAAGLQVGDRVPKVDNQPVTSWDQFRGTIAARPGQTFPVKVEREGQVLDLQLTPAVRGQLQDPDVQAATTDENRNAGYAGVAPGRVIEDVGVLAAIGRSAKQVGSDTVTVIKSIGHVFSPTGVTNYTKQLSGDLPQSDPEAAKTRFVSPVGLWAYAQNVTDAGMREALLFLYAINMFVGIFNLVPLLPFDGGHVAVATYEKFRSSRGKRYMVDFNKLLPLTYAVVFVLILIASTSLWLDITDPPLKRS